MGNGSRIIPNSAKGISLDIKWLDEYFITKLTLSELAVSAAFLAGKGYTFVVVLQDSNVLPAINSKDQNELA